jgi:hypothetical protein
MNAAKTKPTSAAQIRHIAEGALEDARQKPHVFRFYLSLFAQPKLDPIVAKYSQKLMHEQARQFEYLFGEVVMNKDALLRRYHYLWTGEAVSALLFATLLFWFASQDGAWQNWIARTYSLGVIILILIQGVIWWRLKIRLLKRKKHYMSSRILKSYRMWRLINWLLIGSFPLVVFIGTQITGQAANSFDTWLGLVFLGGAVLEQVNYYYYQLMYDLTYDWAYLRRYGRLRQGTIAKALDKHTTKIISEHN